MEASPHSPSRRITASVLAAVAVVGGAVVLLGDRFEATPSYALDGSTRRSTRIAACVADENMRLIDPAREQCRPGEIELISRG